MLAKARPNIAGGTGCFSRGGAPFPVAAPSVVDAEGAELSGKPLVATTRRRHAARGGRDHQGVDGRNRDDCDLRLSLVFCDGCAGPLATASLFLWVVFYLFSWKDAFQCPPFATRVRGLLPMEHRPKRDGPMVHEQRI